MKNNRLKIYDLARHRLVHAVVIIVAILNGTNPGMDMLGLNFSYIPRD